MITMNGWHVSSLVCTLISLLLLVIALASDYWVVIGSYYFGLWKLCDSIVCVKVERAHLQATQAFMILGMLDGLVSTGLLCTLFGRSQIGSFSVTKNAAYFNYSAGLFALIGMSIFTGVENVPGFYSWSFGLGWACCPLFFVADSPYLHCENLWPFFTMDAIHLAALLCTIVSIVMLMVSLRTRHWVDLGHSFSGLWEVCFNTLIGTSCIGYGSDISDHIHATRAFLCFAVICTIVAFFALGVSFFRSHIGAFPLVKVAAVFNAFAALFSVIALATFTGVEVPNQFFGWSFGLGWACIPLCIISAVLAYKVSMDSKI